MKKMLSILLAMAMCLTAVAALAETAATADPAAADTEIPSTEVPMSYTDGQVIDLGDTALTLTIPADWVAMTAPEGTLLVYQDAGATVAMTVSLLDMTMDQVMEQCKGYIDAGTGKQAAEAMVNGIDYYLYDAADNKTSQAFFAYSDTQVLAISFQTATENDTTTIPMEIIGSLADAGDDAADTADTAAAEATATAAN